MNESNLHALVIDAIRDPILVVDATGEVLLANPAAIRLLELTRGGATATGSGLNAGAVMELVRRAERVGGPVTENSPEHGGVAIDVEPIIEHNGERRWLMRVRAPEVLSNEIVADRAIADVAHEIKNPITAMLNALGALPLPAREEVSPAANAGRAARGVFERSVRRLARLVNGLLDLSRMREGTMSLDRTPTAAPEFVRRVVNDFRSLHPDASDRIECSIQDGVAMAFIDPDRVEQSLWNLLSNAIRFTPRTGTVRVHVSTAGVESMDDGLRLVPWDVIGRPRLLRIDVEDSGLGMTSDTLDHLFERHHDPGANPGGAHLGLNITRALVDAHDGWLTVESRLGEGTLVSAFLPVDAQSAAVLSRVRRAERDAQRRLLAHRPTAVAVIQKTRSAAWGNVLSAWPVPVRLDPRDATLPREAAVWSLSDAIAVALLPLSDADGDVASALGMPVSVIDDGAWVMDGFVTGWCGDRERVSFAQAFHRAASRMSRALGGAGRAEAATAGAVAESVEAGGSVADA